MTGAPTVFHSMLQSETRKTADVSSLRLAVTGAASVYLAYTFKLSARDLARFDLLYLNGGKWHDRQIVPDHWVAERVQPHSQSEFGPGYGYLWWTGFVNNSMAPVVTLPQGAFFA